MLEGVFLFTLFYSQWKVIKYGLKFIFGHRDEIKLNEDKEAFDRDVATIEPFVEATFQVRNVYYLCYLYT